MPRGDTRIFFTIYGLSDFLSKTFRPLSFMMQHHLPPEPQIRQLRDSAKNYCRIHGTTYQGYPERLITYQNCMNYPMFFELHIFFRPTGHADSPAFKILRCYGRQNSCVDLVDHLCRILKKRSLQGRHHVRRDRVLGSQSTTCCEFGGLQG